MAKLPETFCVRAVRIRSLIDEGQTHKAHALVVEALRQGTASKPIQAIAAEMLTPKSRGRGAPKKANPSRWYEIGVDYESLVARGLNPTKARLEISRQTGLSDTHIRNCVKAYEAAMEEYDAAMAQEDFAK